MRPASRRISPNLGEKPFRARQVLRWIHPLPGRGDFDAMTDIAKSLREKLRLAASIVPRRSFPTGFPTTERASSCSTSVVEMLSKPSSSPRTTGGRCACPPSWLSLDLRLLLDRQTGFNRNLTVAEIIGQLWQANRALGADPNGDRIISNVVLMGMGGTAGQFR